MRALIAVFACCLLIAPAASAAVPDATTGNANQLTQTSARLHGTVRPNNEATTWRFEYGTTVSYGATTPEQGPIAPGSGNTAVQIDVAGLAPGTVYHYRVVATNASGSIPGRDRTFTTRPAVSLDAASRVASFNRSVTLGGQVFGTAVSGITVRLQENPYPFGGWDDIATTTTDSAGRYQFIRPVRVNTAWRVVAETRPAGTSNTAFVLAKDSVTLKASTSRPKRGRSVLFTGFSMPARVGGPVAVQRLTSRGWRTVARATLSATTIPDTASYAVRLRRVRSGLYRAYVPGGYDHLADASTSKRIRVRR